MEKIQTICLMRDLFLGLRQLEDQLIEQVGVDLNEAILLCALGSDSRLSTEVSRLTGFLPAHTSKLLASLERRNLIKRTAGSVDRRQVVCQLTEAGLSSLDTLRGLELDYPPTLQKLL